MAQKLDADLNIIQRSGIEIQIDPLTKDLNIIQALDDEPNDVGGMSAQELKETFDRAGNIIKDYINDSLIPQVLGADATEQQREENEEQRQANEAQRQENEAQRKANETARQEAESAREAAEDERASAEEARQTAFDTAQSQRAEVFTESQTAQTAAFIASQEDREERFEAEEARRNLWENYDPAKTYVPGNKVYYLGSSYVNTAACAGISPYDETHWQIVAKKGQDGEGASPYDYALTAGYEGTEEDFKKNFGKSPWLPMSGGSMTGPVTVLDPTEPANPATKQSLDALYSLLSAEINRVLAGAWTIVKINQYPWQCVCFGAEKFVALSYNTRYMTYSSNGISWTLATMTAAFFWNSVCYGNGKFVAVAKSQADVAYSTNGKDWTGDVTLPFSNGDKYICYGGGKFVVVSTNGGYAAYSTDGLTWTSVRMPYSTATGWRAVCYGNGRFVAVAMNSQYAAYSTNGITWNAASLPNYRTWYSVCYGNGVYVAVAGNSQYAAYSTDGITWHEEMLPCYDNWDSVCYGNGMFIAISCESTQVVYSRDGITWGKASMPLLGNWVSLCYGQGKLLTIDHGYSTDGSDKVIFLDVSFLPDPRPGALKIQESMTKEG